jgi:hypothetical protein
MRQQYRHVRSCQCLLVALLLAASCSLALAGDRDHEDGVFLRLSAGGGSANTSISDGVDEIELSGSIGDLNIAIGGMVAPNLALHGTLFGWSASSPGVKVNGVDLGDLPGDVTAAAIGVGLTYYFMPANFYLSGSVGSGRMELDMGGFNGETDRGLMIDLTLGKEWWVGDSWGLGIAAGLQHLSLGEPGTSEKWSGNSFALRFTATMN